MPGDPVGTRLEHVIAPRHDSPCPNGREERDHDLRAALFGIEASAEGLSRHRERLTPQQFDRLAAGLAAEVRRLRSLLDGDRRRAGHLRSRRRDRSGRRLRAARPGLDVRVSVPRGIEVIGRRDTTAQVVLGPPGQRPPARPWLPGRRARLGVVRRGRRSSSRIAARGSLVPRPSASSNGGCAATTASAPGWACSSLGV